METFANANQNPGSSCCAPNRCAKDVAKLHAAPIAQKPIVTAGEGKKNPRQFENCSGLLCRISDQLLCRQKQNSHSPSITGPRQKIALPEKKSRHLDRYSQVADLIDHATDVRALAHRIQCSVFCHSPL